MSHVGYWRTHWLDASIVVHELHGRADRMSLVGLAHELDAAAARTPVLTVVDVSDCEWPDDAVLSLLLGYAARARARDAVLTVAGANAAARRVLDRGLARELRLVPTVSEALASFRPPPTTTAERSGLTRWVTEQRFFPRVAGRDDRDADDDRDVAATPGRERVEHVDADARWGRSA